MHPHMHYCTALVNAAMHGECVPAAIYGEGMNDWPLEYVRRVMTETGLSPTALAELAKVSSSTLTRPLNNPRHPHSVSRRTLDKIRDATGIDYTTTEQRAAISSPADKLDDARVPIYDIAASAGHGALVDYEAQVDSLALPREYLRRLTSTSPQHLAIISVKGESMVPTLLDEDVVMVDTTKRSLGYDGLFVLRFDGTLHVKRVARGDAEGMVRIISDNLAYPPFERAIGDVQVMGKILWVGRKA